MINTAMYRLPLPTTFSAPRIAMPSAPSVLDAFTLSAPPSGPSAPPSAPPAQTKTVGGVAWKTLIGAAEGAFGGFVGGTMGGVIGGLTGVAAGGGLGFHIGGAIGMHLAEKAGQGQVNPIAGGIGALALPVAIGFVGAVVGTTAFAIMGSQSMPLAGALAGGLCALASELCR